MIDSAANAFTAQATPLAPSFLSLVVCMHVLFRVSAHECWVWLRVHAEWSRNRAGSVGGTTDAMLSSPEQRACGGPVLQKEVRHGWLQSSEFRRTIPQVRIQPSCLLVIKHAHCSYRGPEVCS